MNLKRISFFSILLTLVVLNIFDAFITLYWIENKLAVEANPLMRGWIDIGPNYFIGLKLSIVFAVFTTFPKLKFKSHASIILIAS